MLDTSPARQGLMNHAPARNRTAVPVVLLLLTVPAAAHAQVALTIDASRKIRGYDHVPLGINVNYLMDDDGYLNPERSTAAALEEMGVKFLRYPGGEKSDNYLWSIAPWDSPNPRFARTGIQDWPGTDTRFAESDRYTCKSTVLDFDEFMTMCRAVGAEPVLVVCFDAMYKPASAGGTAPGKDLLKETAVEWVRYANVTKEYDVKYWEIGNESYHPGSYNGTAPDAATYARDLKDFARAMKEVDPTIKIGANGNGEWWNTLLSSAGEEIDFLSVHTYPAWDYPGYTTYRDNSPDFTHEVNSAISAVGTTNTFVALTEFNAIYWAEEAGWSNTNDMGHAVAVFDMAMQNILEEKLAFALLWNTRWVDNARTSFDINDALDRDGNLNATGKALSIVGNHLLPTAVSVSGLTRQVRAWASINETHDTLNVFVLNKGPGEVLLDAQVQGMDCDTRVLRVRLHGTGPDDTVPVAATRLDSSLQSGLLSIPDVSISVISYLKRRDIVRAAKQTRTAEVVSIPARSAGRLFDIRGRRVEEARRRLNCCGVRIRENDRGALLTTIHVPGP